MANGSASASEFQELAARYEALERQANNLLAAMSRGRSIRNFLLLALLVLVGALAYTIYQMGERLRSPKFMTQLTDVAMARVEANGPAVQRQLLTLYEKSSPVLAQAFQARAEKDQPKYVAAAEKEWPKFQADLQQRLEDRLRDQYKAAILAARPELERLCPELKTDPTKYQKLEDGLVGVAERMVDQYYTKNIPPRFQKLAANWDTFPPAPKPRPDEESIGTQIIGHLVELLGMAFAQGDALSAIADVQPPKPASRKLVPTGMPAPPHAGKAATDPPAKAEAGKASPKAGGDAKKTDANAKKGG